MFFKFGYEVKRSPHPIGNLSLDKLPVGQHRVLTQKRSSATFVRPGRASREAFQCSRRCPAAENQKVEEAPPQGLRRLPKTQTKKEQPHG